MGFIKLPDYEAKKTKRFKEKIGRIENMSYDTAENNFTCLPGRTLPLRRE